MTNSSNYPQQEKVRVGFGPVFDPPEHLGVRAWRVDPIVDYLNSSTDFFTAETFIHDDNHLERFDIIVIVKIFHRIPDDYRMELKGKGVKFIYDITDNPSGGIKVSYDKAHDFITSMDAVIASSPLHQRDLENNERIVLIEHPIIQSLDPIAPKVGHDFIQLVWQGYVENSAPMSLLHEVTQELRRDLQRDIRLLYNVNQPSRFEDYIEYRKWDIDHWDDVLREADIGVTIKPLDDYYQQRKPSNKVQTYMAAGLPVVCTPCEADKAVIEDGYDGFFAYTQEEWFETLRKLILSEELRLTTGARAQEKMKSQFSIPKIAKKYTDLFHEIL